MRLRLIATICVAGFACAAWAQTPEPAGEEPSWVGQVTGTDVYVRSSADNASYPCLKLSAPAQVSVVGKLDEWLKILPPSDAFSIIDKRYVTPDESGTGGTVNAGDVNVRAGTVLIPSWTRVKDHDVVQAMLGKGDKVTIVGQGEEYYKIAPPKGAFLYISEKYVEKVAAAKGAGEAVAAATQPAEGAGELVKGKSIEEIKAALAPFEALEEEMKAEFKKPPEQRDLQSLLDKYGKMDIQGKEYLEPYVKARVGLLQSYIERTRDLKQLEDELKAALASQQQFQLDRTKIEVAPTTRPAPTYASRGILVPSAIFTGSGGSPKRFVIREPTTLRITAYAQCTSGTVNLAQYSGKEVGLVGNKEYDKQLDADVVEVQQVVVLKDTVEIEGPPEPTVEPEQPSQQKLEPALQPPVGPAKLPEPKSVKPTEPETPAIEPETPAAEPETPATEPETPAAEPEEPAAEPETPAADPETPAAEPEEPAAEPETPAAEPKPAEPAGDSAAPAESPREAAKPAEGPLPPTGLPLVAPGKGPTTQPVDKKEFE